MQKGANQHRIRINFSSIVSIKNIFIHVARDINVYKIESDFIIESSSDSKSNRKMGFFIVPAPVLASVATCKLVNVVINHPNLYLFRSTRFRSSASSELERDPETSIAKVATDSRHFPTRVAKAPIPSKRKTSRTGR